MIAPFTLVLADPPEDGWVDTGIDQRHPPFAPAPYALVPPEPVA